MQKPDRVFDRDREWQGLVSFAADPQPGALLGTVSGRRRQGKSYLLEALTESLGGLYFGAVEATEAESLQMFEDALTRCVRPSSPYRFRGWLDAIRALFEAFRERPVPVVLDEFPFLVRASPSLPSIIQRELGPGGSGRDSRVRLLICGSAMSVMGKLLAGQAPLRGRAGLEMIVRPFGYADAARFWGLSDPRLAVRVHAVVGGTPAYRREFVRGDAPAGPGDFDDWVIRTVLDNQMPIFREARYLLAEETDIRDPGLYHSVLAAVAGGNATWGGIAGHVGRRSSEISHPLNVLEDACLLTKERDAFRSGRTRYRITEPLIIFYEAVMRTRWAELERGGGAAVWRDQRARFSAQVLGPHFEALCREFAAEHGRAVFGEPVGDVLAGTLTDPADRARIEVDVAVLAPTRPGEPRRVVSLGEAKWGTVMGRRHVDRLRRARDLLTAKGYDTRDTVLACFTGAGFDGDLRAAAGREPVVLVDLERLYAAPRF